MKVVKIIVLLDSSRHDTKQQAERHLYNCLSKGDSLALFEAMSVLSPLQIREAFINNLDRVKEVCKIITELQALDNLDF